MENGWSLFNNNCSGTTSSGGSRGQNSHSTTNLLAWEVWDLGTSPRFDWSSNNSFHHEEDSLPSTAATAAAAATAHPEGNGVHALMLTHQGHNGHQTVNAGAGSRYHPDPHFMCLKLGKRHYFEDAASMGDRQVGGLSIAKRGRSFYGGGGVVLGPSTSPDLTVASPAAVPRCQVEGCHVALVNAKDYHRRHKVCEMHSKAPLVVVLGLEQRFCQQCSRFHKVCEFDDSKRSCRRRLAGHNERRRKGSNNDSIARNPSQGGAFSLLSSKSNSWFSSADLSSRCSAALRELIAENRATILARQLVIDGDLWHRHHNGVEDLNGSQPGSGSSLQLISSSSHRQMYAAGHHQPNCWDRFNEGGGGGGEHVTLDLMEAPSSAFGFLSVGGKSKEEEDGCSELWSSLG